MTLILAPDRIGLVMYVCRRMCGVTAKSIVICTRELRTVSPSFFFAEHGLAALRALDHAGLAAHDVVHALRYAVMLHGWPSLLLMT